MFNFMFNLIFLFIFIITHHTLFAGRILFVPPMISGSHKLGMVVWADALAERGHEVYWWAPGVQLDKYQPKKVKNVEHFLFDYDTTELMEQYKEQVWTGLRTEPYFITSLTLQLTPMCETVLVNFNESFQNLLSRKYDLIILDEIMNPCGFLIAHLTKAPIILHISTCRLTRQSVNFNNIPSPYAYSGCIGDREISSDRLTFVDRTRNTFSWMSAQLADEIFYSKISTKLKNFYPDLEDIRRDIVRPNFQFVSMPSILDFPGPFQRNLIYLGGLNLFFHQNELSETFDSVLDSVTNGFILMATGHWGNWDTAPEKLRQTFVNAFNLLPKNYTVIWQYKGPPLPSLGENIKLMGWIPQRKLLGHPKCKLFITHCGCNSLNEAIKYGVPIVALPLAFDQTDGAARMVSRGLGTLIRKNNITVENLFDSIMNVLQNNSYERNIKKFSKQSIDDILNPLEKVIFWTEFSIKHKNVYRISSISFDQSILFYYCIDSCCAFILFLSFFIFVT